MASLGSNIEYGLEGYEVDIREWFYNTQWKVVKIMAKGYTGNRPWLDEEGG